ncbi:MAG: major capsid protein [Candidatus Polarisedimenticolia bacterium]|nr:hypothetical protein [bacterium]
MAVIDNTLPTLLDQARRTDPQGGIAAVVEQLTKRNPLLEDMVFQEGNLPTGHRFVSRTSLPSVAWRRLNEGISPSKSGTTQVDEVCGQVAGLSVLDVDVADLNGNGAAFRASEDLAFLQSLNNEANSALFYASTKANPEKICGFAPRFDLSSAIGGGQIVKCDSGASGNDQTSIWLICWGPQTAFGIFPKGSQAGIKFKDLGSQLWDDGTGKKFEAYVSSWKWHLGLCVKDYRYVVRIANVDTGSLASNGTNVVEAMIRAYNTLEDTNTGRMAWYCNRTIGTYLHLQAMNSTRQSTLSVDNIAGKPIVSFLGAPIRITDSILNTESVVA